METALSQATTLAPAPDAGLKAAMRCMAGGVSVITVGSGDDRTGMTVTSAISLSMSPATMLVCINLSASSWAAMEKYRCFCVNILDGRQEAVADRFAGRNGCAGRDRYLGAEWDTLGSGAPALVGALANVDCVFEEAVIRHTHAIVLGSVCATRIRAEGSPLTYWHGAYGKLSVR